MSFPAMCPASSDNWFYVFAHSGRAHRIAAFLMPHNSKEGIPLIASPRGTLVPATESGSILHFSQLSDSERDDAQRRS